jgi:glycine cleavage system H protein
MSNSIPENLSYTKDHEWTKIENDVATVGITDFAQSSLGDIVFVELPGVGDTLEQGGTFGVVESIKSVSDLYSPLDGEVIEVNEELESAPESINQSAYDSWIVKIKMSKPEQVNELLTYSQYGEICND